MAIKIMNAVWQAEYPHDPGGCLVLLALADCANDSGICWPSVATLARKSRQSVRKVRYVIKELESAGVLKVLRSSGGRHSNKYWLNVKRLESSELLASVRPVKCGPVWPDKG